MAGLTALRNTMGLKGDKSEQSILFLELMGKQKREGVSHMN